mmetsp:Transcript_47216/g.75648  ORF Transcript_47216/g.75648 Transcript_47216/m.75648 type:complete len:234 (+) Transcript_47216:761-1462(+)
MIRGIIPCWDVSIFIDFLVARNAQQLRHIPPLFHVKQIINGMPHHISTRFIRGERRLIAESFLVRTRQIQCIAAFILLWHCNLALVRLLLLFIHIRFYKLHSVHHRMIRHRRETARIDWRRVEIAANEQINAAQLAANLLPARQQCLQLLQPNALSLGIFTRLQMRDPDEKLNGVSIAVLAIQHSEMHQHCHVAVRQTIHMIVDYLEFVAFIKDSHSIWRQLDVVLSANTDAR